MKHLSKIFKGFLLTFCLISLMQFGTIPASNVTPMGESLEIQSSATAQPHRVLPVSILVYTEYIDPYPGPTNEWNNTMEAIAATYGPGFHCENLTDYTDLATELPKHDILLIPEQEQADGITMQIVGSAWATILTNFVNDGGIVILMAFRKTVPTSYSPTAQIYNESGLLQFTGITKITGAPVYLSDPSDALARGVNASFTAPIGSISFNTTETNAVVTDGASPMVIHKIMGKGHVVLLGFDLYEVEGNVSMILANSIRLHQHVAFDGSHLPFNLITTGFNSFAMDLVSNGFAVSTMNTLSSAYLSACDVLVLTPGTMGYDSAEIDIIEDFVNAGGGLFVVLDWSAFGDALDPVMGRFGFTRDSTNYLNDTNDYTVEPRWVVYGTDTMTNHSITQKVDTLEFYRGTGLQSIPASATILVTTDTDGTGVWSTGAAAIGVPVAASVVTSGNGRVAVITDSNLLRSDENTDGDGTVDYFDGENEIFLVNSIRWLSAAGITEKHVLFEESHMPHYNLVISYVGLGQLLTANGFTVHWSNTFHPSFVNQMDILIINDGTWNYTAPEIANIKAFVGAGGSLLLLSCYDVYGTENDVIGNEFGISAHTTGEYLNDSDDSWIMDYYVTYEESNFASHFIMQGVSRVELLWTTGFDTIGSATPLITTDTDGTSGWSSGAPANGVPVMVAEEYSNGRLVYSLSYVHLRHNLDADIDGIDNLYEQDNYLLAARMFQWLAWDDSPGGNGDGGIPGFSIIFVFVAVLPLLLLKKKVKPLT